MQNIFMLGFLVISATFAYFGLDSKALFIIATATVAIGFVYTILKLPTLWLDLLSLPYLEQDIRYIYRD